MHQQQQKYIILWKRGNRLNRAIVVVFGRVLVVSNNNKNRNGGYFVYNIRELPPTQDRLLGGTRNRATSRSTAVCRRTKQNAYLLRRRCLRGRTMTNNSDESSPSLEGGRKPTQSFSAQLPAFLGYTASALVEILSHTRKGR